MKTLLILFSLVISSSCYAEDYREFSWGMSSTEVVKILHTNISKYSSLGISFYDEEGNVIIYHDDRDTNYSFIHCDTKVLDNDIGASFTFIKNNLVKVILLQENEKGYKEIIDGLLKKYGEPSNDYGNNSSTEMFDWEIDTSTSIHSFSMPYNQGYSITYSSLKYQKDIESHNNLIDSLDNEEKNKKIEDDL